MTQVQSVKKIRCGKARKGLLEMSQSRYASRTDPLSSPGEEAIEGMPSKAIPPLLPLLETLEVVATRRRQSVRAEINLTLQLKAYVRRLLTKSGKDIGKKPIQAAHIKRFQDDVVVQRLSAMLKPVRLWRKQEEKLMCLGVIGLPAFESFWRPVRGLGELGFAQLIAEAGCLYGWDEDGEFVGYQNWSKVWRRFGLHVFGGKAYATWRSQGGLTANQWVEAGYSTRRRSLMFNIVDSLLRCKTNVYHQRYQAFKAREFEKAAAEGLKVVPAKKIPKGKEADYRSLKHVDLRARRKVAKALLRDLWKVWRREANLIMPKSQSLNASRPPSKRTGGAATRRVPKGHLGAAPPVSLSCESMDIP